MNILSENVGRYKMVFRLFSFSACNSAKTEVSYDTTEGGEYSNASEPPFYSLRATSDFNTLEPPQTQDIVMEP